MGLVPSDLRNRPIGNRVFFEWLSFLEITVVIPKNCLGDTCEILISLKIGIFDKDLYFQVRT